MEANFRYSARLADVSFPILVANAELCGDRTTHRLGVLAPALEHYGNEWREIAMEHFGIGEHLTVVSITKGSPAELGGMLPGDRLLRINGEPLGTGKDADAAAGEILRKHSGGKLTVTIKREGKRRTIAVEPAVGCDYQVTVAPSDDVNAWADGNNIFISKGMLRFTETDDELALVVGHELAHNTRGHIDSKTDNGAALWPRDHAAGEATGRPGERTGTDAAHRLRQSRSSV